MPQRKKIIWRSPSGDVIACLEKNKVLQENLVEIRQVCQDAFEDAVLMGCDEQQIRAVFIELMNNLESAYPPQE
jgi:Mor family transcriptional regulator